MAFSSVATRTSGNGGQFSSRGLAVDHFVVHHAATSSLSQVLGMMSSGSRQVSSNYVVKDGDVVGVVPEERRSWSLSSSTWDGRSITVETCNSVTGDASGWPISEESYRSLAKLIADCATRYGFPINRDRVIGHREVYTRHGASYPTACPGGIDLDRLVRMAQEEQSGARPAEPKFLGSLTDADRAEVMALFRAIRGGQLEPEKRWTLDQQITQDTAKLTDEVRKLRAEAKR